MEGSIFNDRMCRSVFEFSVGDSAGWEEVVIQTGGKLAVRPLFQLKLCYELWRVDGDVVKSFGEVGTAGVPVEGLREEGNDVAFDGIVGQQTGAVFAGELCSKDSGQVSLPGEIEMT